MMEILKFGHIESFYGIFLIIPVIGLFLLWMISIQKRRKQFSENFIHKDKTLLKRRIIKLTLSVTAIVFMILTLADLQSGSRIETVRKKGSDIVFAVDLSRSMLAADVLPTRLDRARQLLLDIIRKLDEDRIGIVVFGGKAYIQMPLTNDLSAVKMFIENLNTDLIPTQGTSVADAIGQSLVLFNANDPALKRILLLTDGEDHEGNIKEAIQNAKNNRVTVDCVSIGGNSPVPIPENAESLQPDYHRDKDNKVVLSASNPSLLKEIAEKTGGNYYKVNENEDDTPLLIDNIEQGVTKTYDSRNITEYEPEFKVFVVFALLFLVLELIYSERKSKNKLSLLKS